jgi:hypothetical protein
LSQNALSHLTFRRARPAALGASDENWPRICRFRDRWPCALGGRPRARSGPHLPPRLGRARGPRRRGSVSTSSRCTRLPVAWRRTALYVCPENGDLYCGAITLVIERQGDEIVWQDFGYETGLDTDPPELDRMLSDLGPYRFVRPQYESVMRSGYGMDGFNVRARNQSP